jgi:hypothetical protein
MTYDPLPPDLKNPYRAGSKKAQAFELFRAGGERADLLAKIAALGVKEATAASWVNIFRKLVMRDGEGK